MIKSHRLDWPAQVDRAVAEMGCMAWVKQLQRMSEPAVIMAGPFLQPLRNFNVSDSRRRSKKRAGIKLDQYGVQDWGSWGARRSAYEQAEAWVKKA